MTRFAIDPPALVQLAERGYEADPRHQLVAPSSLRSCALDLLLRRVRSGGAFTERDALALHERMTEIKIRLLGDRVSRRTSLQLAIEHGWPSIEQAEYVAVAILQADALIALDEDLAARARGIVPLASLSALLPSGRARH